MVRDGEPKSLGDGHSRLDELKGVFVEAPHGVQGKWKKHVDMVLTRIEVHFQESYRRKAADLCWGTRHVSMFFALELRGNPDHLSRVRLGFPTLRTVIRSTPG